MYQTNLGKIALFFELLYLLDWIPDLEGPWQNSCCRSWEIFELMISCLSYRARDLTWASWGFSPARLGCCSNLWTHRTRTWRPPAGFHWGRASWRTWTERELLPDHARIPHTRLTFANMSRDSGGIFPNIRGSRKRSGGLEITCQKWAKLLRISTLLFRDRIVIMIFTW